MRKFTLVISFFMVLLFFTSAFNYPILAQSANETFTYDLDNQAIAAPEPMEFYKNITGEALGIGIFNSPSDVCNDSKENLYIADSGNNRIVIVSKQGELLKVIDKVFVNGVAETLKNPEGITVTDDNELYICDTNNRRIVHLGNDFNVKRILSAPIATALGEDFNYIPVKITVDKLGRIYVVSRNYNSGIIELTKTGEFNKIYGSIQVEYNLADILWRMVSTKAQRDRSASLIPNEYSSVCSDENNFIYACSAYYDSSSVSIGSIKKLNALGQNNLKKAPKEGINLYSKGLYGGGEKYVDICSMGNDIYALLDNTKGRIFVYNGDGDMLYEFGGKGVYNSTFGTVAALSYCNNYFYVADSKENFVSSFILTNYGRSFSEAAAAHKKGDYETENKLWTEIYRLNNNNICAIRNFGRVNYRTGNYKEAMKYFKLANDRDSYSSAYEKQRKEITNENFTLIVVSIFVILIAFISFRVYRKKHPKKEIDRFSYRGTLNYSKKVIFRPLVGFWDMKREKYGSTLAAITILVIVTVFYAAFNSLKGFIFSSGTSTSSLLVGISTVLLPFFLFALSNWCVSNLMDGEGSFKYIFMGTAYSLTPMIYLLPVALLLSTVLTKEEGSIYTLVIGIMLLWSFFLVVCSNMEIHSYTMGKTILVLFITLLVMVIIIFFALLIFALIQQMIGVGSDVINELYLRF